MIDTQTQQIRSLAFEASRDCACFWVRQVSRRITRAYDEALRPIGLKATQFTMLAAIVATGGKISLTKLAVQLGMERSTFSRNLQPLVRRGLVRHVDDMKGRSRGVEATEAGHAAFRRAEPAWRQAQAGFRDALGDGGFPRFIDHMQSISKAF